MLGGELPWSIRTDRVGFPETWEVRFIAWAPALAAAMLRPFLGPVAAYNVVVLLSPVTAVIAGHALLRRWAPPWTAAAGALAWALSPYLVGALASGQTCKAQIWVLPAVLAAFAATLDARGRALLPRVLVLAGVTVAAAFTEASYALLLPFALGVLAIAEVLAGPDRGRRVLLAILGLAVVALALVPAQHYYDPVTTNVGAQAFHPAFRPATDADRLLSVMTWESAFGGVVRAPIDAHTAVHVTYLTLPLVAAALLLGGWGRGGRVGLAWALTGGVLAAGELLVRGGQVVHAGAVVYALPDALLARVGYPLAKSGMYYRAVVLAGLGLAAAVTGGAARLGPRRGGVLAWVVAALVVGDGLHATRALWPRVVQPIPGLAAYTAIATDPGPGAVLDLPFSGGDYVGQSQVRGAAITGRRTTGMPRGMRLGELPHLDRLVRRLDAALAAPDPADRLRALGFAYVVYQPLPADAGPDRATLVAALGPPQVADGVWWWKLSLTPRSPRPPTPPASPPPGPSAP
jgi:hypothetical protein